MPRTSKLLASVLILAALGCAKPKPGDPPHSKVGVAVAPPASGRTINFDPSVVGLPGAINDTVYDSAGVISWIKYGTSNTAWRPVPVSQFVTGSPATAPGLKAPLGFVVTMTDGTASWVKSTSSDTGWVTNPPTGGSGIPDGGLPCQTVDGGPISGNCTSAAPLAIANGAIGLPKLAPLADQTLLGNISGGAASAIALTKAQVLTLLGVSPVNDVRYSVLQRAQALCGSTLNTMQGTEFDNVGTFGYTGGLVTLSPTLSGGVAQVSTTATAFTLVRNYMYGSTASVSDFRTVKWYAYWRAAIASVVEVNTQLYMGVIRAAGQTDLAVGLFGNVDTTHWSVTFRDPSGAQVKATTATSVAIDLNFHDIEIWNDLTNYYIAIDGTIVYQVAVSSSAGTEAPRQDSVVYNGNQATARQLNVDRMWFVTTSN